MQNSTEQQQYQELHKIDSEFAYCLVLSVSAALHTDMSWLWKKSEDYRENLLLHQLYLNQQILLLALFDINPNNASRPQQLSVITSCVISAEGSAAFRITRQVALSDEQWESTSQFLMLKMVLPQTEISRNRKKRQLDTLQPSDAQEAKRQMTQALPEQAPFDEVILLDFPADKIQEQQQTKESIVKPAELPWKETRLGEITYRSKLEAQTACFMANCGIRFSYECISLHLSNSTTYTPDFWLPEQKLFIEIKPAYPHLEELAKCEAVAASGFDIVLLYGRVGPPFATEDRTATYHRHYDHSENARGIAWSGQTGERLPGEWVWLWDNKSQTVVLSKWCDSKDQRWSHPKILDAFASAQQLSLR